MHDYTPQQLRALREAVEADPRSAICPKHQRPMDLIRCTQSAGVVAAVVLFCIDCGFTTAVTL